MHFLFILLFEVFLHIEMAQMHGWVKCVFMEDSVTLNLSGVETWIFQVN